MKGAFEPMSLAPQRATFIVPPAPAGSSAAPKPTRESTPFVIVPTAFDDREALEPHWLPTIDAATD
jgi:hypothetical protein